MCNEQQTRFSGIYMVFIALLQFKAVILEFNDILRHKLAFSLCTLTHIHVLNSVVVGFFFKKREKRFQDTSFLIFLWLSKNDFKFRIFPIIKGFDNF